MVQEPFSRGRLITVGDDPRITRVGRSLRKTKIDELPQLIDVLKGDMSLVGHARRFGTMWSYFEKIMNKSSKFAPGITDLACFLTYHDEAAVLKQVENREAEYCGRILPDKISLSKEYLKKSSFVFDLAVILKTLPKIFA